MRRLTFRQAVVVVRVLTRHSGKVAVAGVVLMLAACSPSNLDRRVAVNGHTLHVTCGGQGPTVVFEPGIGGDHSLWPIAERIRSRAYACVYDRPGSGDSPPAAKPMTARGDVADLHALLTTAGIPRPVVMVGHSYGGLIAWMAAVEHPEDVSGAVLIDASHPDDIGRLEAVLNADQRRVFEQGLANPNVDFVASLQQAAAEYGTPQDLPLTVIAATKSMTPWCAQGLPCATMDAVHQELQAANAHLTSRGRLVEADTGHSVQDEDPDLVVREIERLLTPSPSP
jgi:pimeloyl-ACP methyl ester carboxylesterase